MEPRTRRQIPGLLTLLLGGTGVLLCLGGIAGLTVVHGKITEVTEEAGGAVDDLLAGVQAGVAAAGPEIAAVRKRLAVRVTEELLPGLREDVRSVRRFLDNVARTGEAAAGILEALDREPEARELSRHLADLEAATRELSEVRLRAEDGPRPQPVLERIQQLLAGLHRHLTNLRLEVSRIHSTVDSAVGTGLLLAGLFLLWMGIGQWALAAYGRRRWTGG